MIGQKLLFCRELQVTVKKNKMERVLNSTKRLSWGASISYEYSFPLLL